MGNERRRATYQDVIDAPEHVVAEIIDGELYTSPRPASPHANAATVIGADLNGAFHHPANGHPGRPGGWWILFEPELHFGEDVLVPDVAGWRRERMPQLRSVAAFTMPPDWVCEVVSPSTAVLDRKQKMRVYLREGIKHLWIVDPITHTLEIYRLEGDHWIVATTYGGSEKVRAEPFDAIELDLTRWWLD